MVVYVAEWQILYHVKRGDLSRAEIIRNTDGAAKRHTEKINNCHTELMNLGERDAFRRGFSLGVRLMVDAMNERN